MLKLINFYFFFFLLLSSPLFAQVEKDNFIFTFPESGLEGTPMTFEVQPYDSSLFYVWDFGHSSQYKVFNWEKFEDRAMGNIVEFTYPGQGRRNGYTAKVTIYKGGLARKNRITEFKEFIPVLNVPPEIFLKKPPSECFEGDEITFTAVHFDPGAADVHFYNWIIEGNEFGPYDSKDNSNKISYTFKDEGIISLTASVRDDDRDSDTIFHEISVKNLPPVIDRIEFPSEMNEGSLITLTGIFSDPGVNDSHEFFWDFGNGVKDTTTINKIDYIYEDNGNFEIKLIIKDNSGDIDSLSSNIIINNVDPIIEVNIPPSADEGQSISLSLNIDDPGNDTHKITWDLGDSTVISIPSFDYIYPDNGDFTINVSVEDDDGGLTNFTQMIKINNLPPVIEISFPDSSSEGENILFDVSVLKDNEVYKYQWDFGDGDLDSTKSPSHKFADNGTYNVSVIVTDKDGLSSTKNKDVHIKNMPPVVDAKFPKKQYEGSKVNVIAAVKSDPGINDTHTFLYDFGDSTFSEESVHIYHDDGEFDIRVVATDNDGASDTLTQQISIINVAPNISGNFVKEVNEGDTINFKVILEDPGTKDSHTFSWDFGDGNTDTVLNATYVYPDDGEPGYDIKLLVTDDDGGVDSIIHYIVVENVAPSISATFLTSSKVQVPDGENIGQGFTEINEIIEISNDDKKDQDPPQGDRKAPILFTAIVDDPGINDMHQYLWDFGDGVTSKESIYEHTYTKNGLFEVKLIVDDGDGGIDSLKKEIVISNITPSMSATLITPDSKRQTVVILPLDEEGTKETNTFSWNFGDFNTSKKSIPIHQYNEHGDFLIEARVLDLDGTTSLNVESISVKNRYPKLIDLLPTDITDSENKDMYFSNETFTISCPRNIEYNPNTFPTLVVTFLNKSDIEKDLNTNLILPDGWEIVNIIEPTKLKPNKKERLRVTFSIPFDLTADEKYTIQLVSKIGDYDHMVALMTTINTSLLEKPAFQLEPYKDTEEIRIDKKESIDFIIRNIGNVSDTYTFNPIIPENWELINLPDSIQLKADSSAQFSMVIRSPDNIERIINKEIHVEAKSKKLNSKVGTWFEAQDSQEGSCTDAREESCSIPSRINEIDCISEGIWIPEIEEKEAYCSDNLFKTEKECIRIFQWIEAKEGVPASCSDPDYKSMSECVAMAEIWDVGYPDQPARCSERSIINKEQCIATRQWYPAVEPKEAFCKSMPQRTTKDECIALGKWSEEFKGSKNRRNCLEERIWYPETENSDGYCSDSTIINQELCEKKHIWTPPIPKKKAYCSDLVSDNKIDCETSVEIIKTASVEIFSKFESRRKKRPSYAQLPIIMGAEIGGLQSNYFPGSRFYIKSPESQFGKIKIGFDFSQRFNTMEIKDTLDTQENLNEYVNDNYIDFVRFLYGYNRWELILGNTYVRRNMLLNSMINAPIPGINNSENFKGLTFKYKFHNYFTEFGYGEGPVLIPDYQIYSFSIGENESQNKNTYYGLYYHTKLDTSKKTNNIINLQRVSSIRQLNLVNAQNFSLNFFENDTTNQFNTSYSGNVLVEQNLKKIEYMLLLFGYGKEIDDLNKGRYGLNLISNYRASERLYLYFNGKVETKLLYDSVLWDDEYDDCGLDNDCYSQDTGQDNAIYDFGENFIDVNNTGIFDSIYVKKSNTLRLSPKLFYAFKNGWKINLGFDYSLINYTNNYPQESKTSYLFKISRTGVTIDESGIGISTGRIGKFNLKYGKYIEPFFDYKISFKSQNTEITTNTKINTGIRIRRGRFNINYEAILNLYSVESSTNYYASSLYGRFKFLKRDWSYRLLTSKILPWDNDFRINILGVEHINTFKFLGTVNRLRVGAFYIPDTKSFTYTFGIIPTGNMSKSKQLMLPFPFVNVKGNYRGEVFIDENKDGIRDINEKGLSDVLVYLNENATLTNSDGEFLLTGIEPGQYSLTIDQNTINSRYKISNENQLPFQVEIIIGETGEISIPVEVLCEISGQLFVDSNRNKSFDSKERLLDNVKIIVQNSLNNDEKIIYTNKIGQYRLSGIKPGLYNLVVDQLWLPSRTVTTYSDKSKNIFSSLGWPVEVSNDNPEIEFNIPINEKELEIRIDVKN